MKIVRSFYSWPLLIQWLVSIVAGTTSIILIFFFFLNLFFPLNFILIPILKSAGHFAVTPLLRLSGYLKYHSAFMLTVKYPRNIWEIHNGTSFDYLLNMKWCNKGFFARQFIIRQYLEGLLNLIEEIKKTKNPDEIEIIGTSYFIGKNTIAKIGFREEKVQFWRKILFVIDYFNLLSLYSFSKGRISFPNINHLKKIKIKGDKLLQAEALLRKYRLKFEGVFQYS